MIALKFIGKQMAASLRQNHGLALVEFALVFPFLFVLVFGGIEITRYIIINQKLEKAGGVVSSIVSQQTPADAATSSGINDDPSRSDSLNKYVFPNFEQVMGQYGCCTATPSEAVIVTSLVKYGAAEIPGCNTGTEPACLTVRWQTGYGWPNGGSWTSALTGFGPTDHSNMKNLCTNVLDFAGMVQSRLCHPPAGLGGGAGSHPLTPEETARINNMVAHENMIVTEVFYQYQPLLEPLLRNVTQANGDTPFSVAADPLYRRYFAYPRETGGLPDLPPDFPARGGRP